MLKLIILLALTTVAVARICQNITVHLPSISARNGVFNINPPTSMIDVTNFFLEFAREGRNYSEVLLDHYATVRGDYTLATTYCRPDHGPGTMLQILTPGLGFDRSYWDLPYNNFNYSYTAHAVDDQGYATLTWDRLGSGNSSSGDALSEIQLWTEIAALRELTVMAKAGKICGFDAKYDKTVQIGHSFGSIMIYSLVNMYPDISDAVVLTGFSHVVEFLPKYLLSGGFISTQSIPALEGKFPTGTLAPMSPVGAHNIFFAPDSFDPDILGFAATTGQPLSLGEILTIRGGNFVQNSFRGPTIIVNGQYDGPFCGGNCSSTSATHHLGANVLDASAQFFKHARVFNATVVPGAGHGLNLAYSHPFTYRTILDFLASHV